MIRRLALILVLGALAGCGADGAPEPRTGITIGGEARIGVEGRL